MEQKKEAPKKMVVGGGFLRAPDKSKVSEKTRKKTPLVEKKPSPNKPANLSKAHQKALEKVESRLASLKKARADLQRIESRESAKLNKRLDGIKYKAGQFLIDRVMKEKNADALGFLNNYFIPFLETKKTKQSQAELDALKKLLKK